MPAKGRPDRRAKAGGARVKYMMAALALVFAAPDSATPGWLYGDLFGLTLASNGPATFALVSVDHNGSTRRLGPSHPELFGCGDLVAIAHGTLYYLGDTHRGTTLVGVSLLDGSERCNAVLPMSEMGFVGFGQTLDFDATTDSLVVSGLKRNATAGHIVLRGSARDCGAAGWQAVANYGGACIPCPRRRPRAGRRADDAPKDAAKIPMLHSSALDAAGQVRRLRCAAVRPHLIRRRSGFLSRWRMRRAIRRSGWSTCAVVGRGGRSPRTRRPTRCWRCTGTRSLRAWSASGRMATGSPCTPSTPPRGAGCRRVQ